MLWGEVMRWDSSLGHAARPSTLSGLCGVSLGLLAVTMPPTRNRLGEKKAESRGTGSEHLDPATPDVVRPCTFQLGKATNLPFLVAAAAREASVY